MDAAARNSKKGDIEALVVKCPLMQFNIHLNLTRPTKYVMSKIGSFASSRYSCLATIKRRKLTRFGHVKRHDSLCKTIMDGLMESGHSRLATGDKERVIRQLPSWMFLQSYTCIIHMCCLVIDGLNACLILFSLHLFSTTEMLYVEKLQYHHYQYVVVVISSSSSSP